MPANQKSNIGVIIASTLITTLFLRVLDFRKEIIMLRQEKKVLQKENDSLRLHQKPTTDLYNEGNKPCAGC